ncbi:Hypothetical predicted protein [Mytilus galloprovincialis]|uniref:Uncharacterized protein n=1 Tax=Mytilus galloprovincialis TaxID=29158 RepID=A0A8B6D7L5_MYTGA|nr:Hypothetical predicted protein [Mytilus galloprovincialis]
MVREVRDCYPIGGGDNRLPRTCVEDRGPERSDEENTSRGCADSARAGRVRVWKRYTITHCDGGWSKRSHIHSYNALCGAGQKCGCILEQNMMGAKFITIALDVPGTQDAMIPVLDSIKKWNGPSDLAGYNIIFTWALFF